MLKKYQLKTIIISVSNDLTNDQRVHKVCSSLTNNGYEVLLLGCIKEKNALKISRQYKTKRLPLLFKKGVCFYAEFNIRLFLYLLFTKKHILLSNDLDTLLPNYMISKLQRKPLVFDSHELFSEVPELINRPFVKSVWLKLEQLLIPKLKNNYTVCKSIARHYKTHYNTRFSIVRNVPNLSHIPAKELAISTNKNIIIYQGAVNIGRGLELMIDTMPYLERYLFLIVGNGDVMSNLQKKVADLNLKDNVIFYGKVTPKELKSITPNAVLGISLEEDLGLNYRYALPNKIFDYIQANIPVICSDLVEMKQLTQKYKIGEIVTNRTPKELAFQIKTMLTKDYSIHLKNAKQELIWENEERILLEIFKNLN